MGSFTAFLDASVLYPAPLRDILLELAVCDLYRAKWSYAVHDEWISALLRTRPDLARERLYRTCDLMNAHTRDALVTEFEDLIEVLTLPDPNDRHVLAAAIKGRADLIVTTNLKDFPAGVLERWGIEASRRVPDAPVPPVAAGLSQGRKDGALAPQEPAKVCRGAPRHDEGAGAARDSQ